MGVAVPRSTARAPQRVGRPATTPRGLQEQSWLGALPKLGPFKEAGGRERPGSQHAGLGPRDGLAEGRLLLAVTQALGALWLTCLPKLEGLLWEGRAGPGTPSRRAAPRVSALVTAAGPQLLSRVRHPVRHRSPTGSRSGQQDPPWRARHGEGQRLSAPGQGWQALPCWLTAVSCVLSS